MGNASGFVYLNYDPKSGITREIYSREKAQKSQNRELPSCAFCAFWRLKLNKLEKVVHCSIEQCFASIL
jgi:hypothetical protein